MVAGADVDECGGESGGDGSSGRFPHSVAQAALAKLSSTQSSHITSERNLKVCSGAATNGCQGAELCAKEKGAREEGASPDLTEHLKANTDCQETPGTDGEDVDMD